MIHGLQIEVIWDPEDEIYVAEVVGAGYGAHGSTYQEAIEEIANVIELLYGLDLA